MKKIFIAVLILGIYLNRSYGYFYDFIGQKNLQPPFFEQTIIPSQNPTFKYVALGDSLTEGVGATSYSNTYPSLLTKKLSAKENVKFINLAHKGDTSLELLRDQLPQAILEKPDLITVLIGINDIHNLISPDYFENNLRIIISSLKKTNARVYLINIPYLGSSKIVLPPYNLILNLRTKQFNQIIKNLADELSVNYIDLYSLEKSSNFYSVDEFHPSDEGYKYWGMQINVN